MPTSPEMSGEMGIEKEKIGKKAFYFFEGLVNDYGDQYGEERHVVWGTDKEDAIEELTKYLEKELEEGKTTLDDNWASDIRGKTPHEAARIRLTEKDGGDDERLWGKDTDIYSQERFAGDIGDPLTEEQQKKIEKHSEKEKGK